MKKIKILSIAFCVALTTLFFIAACGEGELEYMDEDDFETFVDNLKGHIETSKSSAEETSSSSDDFSMSSSSLPSSSSAEEVCCQLKNGDFKLIPDTEKCEVTLVEDWKCDVLSSSSEELASSSSSETELSSSSSSEEEPSSSSSAEEPSSSSEEEPSSSSAEEPSSSSSVEEPSSSSSAEEPSSSSVEEPSSSSAEEPSSSSEEEPSSSSAEEPSSSSEEEVTLSCKKGTGIDTIPNTMLTIPSNTVTCSDGSPVAITAPATTEGIVTWKDSSIVITATCGTTTGLSATCKIRRKASEHTTATTCATPLVNLGSVPADPYTACFKYQGNCYVCNTAGETEGTNTCASSWVWTESAVADALAAENNYWYAPVTCPTTPGDVVTITDEINIGAGTTIVTCSDNNNQITCTSTTEACGVDWTFTVNDENQKTVHSWQCDNNYQSYEMFCSGGPYTIVIPNGRGLNCKKQW